jgi:hypothetical protein
MCVTLVHCVEVLVGSSVCAFVATAATAVSVTSSRCLTRIPTAIAAAYCRYVSRAEEHFAALRRRTLLASARALMLGDYHNSVPAGDGTGDSPLLLYIVFQILVSTAAIIVLLQLLQLLQASSTSASIAIMSAAITTTATVSTCTVL